MYIDPFTRWIRLLTTNSSFPGLNPFKKITLVKKIKYKDSLLETAWPLGSAIDAVSSQN